MPLDNTPRDHQATDDAARASTYDWIHALRRLSPELWPHLCTLGLQLQQPLPPGIAWTRADAEFWRRIVMVFLVPTSDPKTPMPNPWEQRDALQAWTDRVVQPLQDLQRVLAREADHAPPNIIRPMLASILRGTLPVTGRESAVGREPAVDSRAADSDAAAAAEREPAVDGRAADNDAAAATGGRPARSLTSQIFRRFIRPWEVAYHDLSLGRDVRRHPSVRVLIDQIEFTLDACRCEYENTHAGYDDDFRLWAYEAAWVLRKNFRALSKALVRLGKPALELPAISLSGRMMP